MPELSALSREYSPVSASLPGDLDQTPRPDTLADLVTVGRRTLMSASSGTGAFIHPVRPIAETEPPSMLARSSADGTAVMVPSYHSEGSCSLHGGCGTCQSSSLVLTATSSASLSTTTRVAVVDTSMPMT
ncbi:MAG: hypothetical protein EA387_12825 [Nitriliruptor sp.]|nr:MAG: hypothetical protein EA387_12825 [Nitriliruptor sp.]